MAGESFWSPVVRDLVPYVPGEQPRIPNLVKLNTNENPYPPSPKVGQAIAQAAEAGLQKYPDPESTVLRAAIAAHHQIAPDQVFVGNGSDEVLAHAFFAFFQHGTPLLMPDVTYTFYAVYARLYGIDVTLVPLDAQYRIRVNDFARHPDAAGVVMANPNAPTGIALPLDDIERLVRLLPQRVVLVDEAYVDFGAESAIGLIDRHPNLLVVHTLSKSRSLAGLRVGFAAGSPGLIAALERVKNSFNSYPLDCLAQAGAVAAIEDHAHFQQTCQAVIASREALARDLTALGMEVLPSAANFLFVRHAARDAASLAAGLRERAVLVRHFRQPRVNQFLRITVGTPVQCVALVQALRELLQ